MNWDLVRGIESLGRGCPFYKHSKCDEVPWPRVNSSMGSEEVWKIMLGEEGYRQELERLGKMNLPEEGEVISHHINMPARVTYTTRLPYFPVPGDENHEHILRDMDSWEGRGTMGPGKCLVTGVRIRARKSWSFGSIGVYISGGCVQTMSWEMFKFMNEYFGMKLVEENEEECLITLPLFFSRDPVYAIPLFVIDELKIRLMSPDPPIGLYADLTVLHTREEIKQISLKHILRTDHLAERRTEGSPVWFFIPWFWRDLGEASGGMRIDYDGSKDEEIKGIFWELSSDENVMVSLSYRFSDGELRFIDSLPQDLVSKSEFQRYFPSMVGGSRSYTGRKYGGYIFSTYFDDGDCSPGVTPRNGELYIEFSKPVTFRTFVYSSRDWINHNKQKDGS